MSRRRWCPTRWCGRADDVEPVSTRGSCRGGASDEIRLRRNRPAAGWFSPAWLPGIRSPSSRPTATSRSRIGGQKLAGSDRAIRLDETGLPTRYYIPARTCAPTCCDPPPARRPARSRARRRTGRRKPATSSTRTLVWSYETPIPAARQIAGLMCFYNERVELTISDLQQDPTTASRQ